MNIISRVHELSEKYHCKMSQIAIAWQWAKGIASPIIGATKPAYHGTKAYGRQSTRKRDREER
jgi:aryl-alcohol dehydrogenase-like predicted oxidoreductase